MFNPRQYGRQLQQGQRSDLIIHDIELGQSKVVFSTGHLIEAPNWTPDGSLLVFNAGGEIWSLSIDGGEPEKIDTGNLNDLNNDHVISPDGLWIYVSSNDSHLYRVPIEGGEPVRVSNTHSEPFHYYLHGVSPNGEELAYVGLQKTGESSFLANIYTIPSSGGPDRQLTNETAPFDGPEYAPDGQSIYFNSEYGADKAGHAQLFLMDRNGGNISKLTDDERVNWFPHLAPDGTRLVYLSYPPETLGHPPDKDVILRLMSLDDLAIHDLAQFNGGQGTINVNSWAPDSRRFAYVSYPLG